MLEKVIVEQMLIIKDLREKIEKQEKEIAMWKGMAEGFHEDYEKLMGILRRDIK